eukprot:175034-Amphidinium_carterae.2
MSYGRVLRFLAQQCRSLWLCTCFVVLMVAVLGDVNAEDIFTMFVAMQSASVAQSAFTVTDAKRLFGLVQLGNSFAAMT